MSTSISGTNILVDIERDNLALSGTYAGGTLPTTAGLFAPGCRLTNNGSGETWINAGTTAVPVWESEHRVAVVNLTAAQIIGMYATPVEIVPAVPGYMLAVDSVDVIVTRTATAFTGGATSMLQYDSTANGLGTATIATLTAATFTGAAGVSRTTRIPVNISDNTAAVGKGLIYSNITGAFATGTGTAVIKVRYRLV